MVLETSCGPRLVKTLTPHGHQIVTLFEFLFHMNSRCDLMGVCAMCTCFQVAIKGMACFFS
jgi:hypothetical protein